MAEKIASNEFNAGQLDKEHRHRVLLGIYPDQSTALHLITSKTTEVGESNAVNQLKALLEPDQEPEDDEPFKAPIIINASGMTPFRQMLRADLKTLSDLMMQYISFQGIVNGQKDVC